MTKKEQILNMLLSLFMIVILVMALLPILKINWVAARYIFAVGAVGILVVKILDRYKGDSLRIKRLYRMGRISGLCYCVSAFFMFWADSPQDWIAFLMAGAILQIYVSYMGARAQKKAAEKSRTTRKEKNS